MFSGCFARSPPRARNASKPPNLSAGNFPAPLRRRAGSPPWLLVARAGAGGACATGFASLFPVVFAAIYWKRANKWGAMASVVTVAVLWLWFLGDALTDEFLIAGMMPVTILLGASSVAMVVGSLVTPPPPQDLQEKFFPKKTS